jgi:hypothetical protein
MYDLNVDIDLHRALAKQEFEQLLSEANKARLIKQASSEKSEIEGTRGFNLVLSIKPFRDLISNISTSTLLALRARNESAKA